MAQNSEVRSEGLLVEAGGGRNASGGSAAPKSRPAGLDPAPEGPGRPASKPPQLLCRKPFLLDRRTSSKGKSARKTNIVTGPLCPCHLRMIRHRSDIERATRLRRICRSRDSHSSGSKTRAAVGRPIMFAMLRSPSGHRIIQ